MCGKAINTPLRDREFDSLVTQALAPQVPIPQYSGEPVNVTSQQAVDAQAIAPKLSVPEPRDAAFDAASGQSSEDTFAKRNCAELHRQAQQHVELHQQAQQQFQNSEGVKPGLSTDIFKGARTKLAEILQAPNSEEQTRLANDFVDKLFTPYYLGRGGFDHVRFLSDVEASKGGRLNSDELQLFGRVAGNWIADKAIAEFEVAVEIKDTVAIDDILKTMLNRISG